MVKVRVTSTVCGRGGVRPHSPSLNSTLTAMESCSGGQAAVTGAQTSCHQSDRRQLSPYIWRPRGLHTSTQPTSLTEFFSASEKTSSLWLHAQGKVKRASLVMLMRKSAKQHRRTGEVKPVLMSFKVSNDH